VEIHPGECARIFTGARIPCGATQVLIQEEVERDGEWIVPRGRDAKTWIRWRGEDARRGDLLLAAGTRLRAGELSLLAQLGCTRPRLSPAPRVLHFATGDELVDPAAEPGVGQIRDSNSILVATLLAEAGARLVAQGRCGDALEALTGAVTVQPIDAWDVLLISGGASVGDYDFGVRALESLGFTVHFRQINLRPGKPLVFATRGRQVAFVIPGNPVSHFVTFHVAIRLALECLEGGPQSWPMAEVELATDLPMKPDARETWWPAHVVAGGGPLRAHPLAWQSSGDLRGLVSANALLPISPGTGTIQRGAVPQALLLNVNW
jgi:molybdopterin molybdotransferase